MDITAARAILARPESESIERTISVTNFDKYAEAICAFANDLSGSREAGYLIVGLTDAGKIAGLKLSDQFLTSLGGLRTDGRIVPAPSMNIHFHAFDEGDVAIVEVHPCHQPPVRYQGRVYIRCGPRKAIATPEDERRLSERRVSHARSFDSEPAHEATLHDLVLSRFTSEYLPLAVSPEVLEENHRSTEVQLATLRFFDIARNRPTNAGVLVFGEEPTRFLPGAYVQFVHYNGETPAAEIEAEYRLTGGLISVVKELDGVLKPLAAERPVTVPGSIREQTVSAYPLVALREFILNALVHRNYQSNSPIRVLVFSNRVVIDNPGSLYGEANPANFPWTVAYRNPVLAEALRTLKVVNRFGRGVFAAQEALRRNGSEEAAFDFSGDTVRCLVPMRQRG